MKIELTDREACLLRTLFEGHIAMADLGPEFFAINDKLVKAGVQKGLLNWRPSDFGTIHVLSFDESD